MVHFSIEPGREEWQRESTVVLEYSLQYARTFDDDFDFVHRNALFQNLGEGRPQLFRRSGNSVGYLSHEVDCLEVIKEGTRIRTGLGLIPEYSCAGSDCKVLRTCTVDRSPRDSFRPDVTRLVPESPCRLLHPCLGRLAPSLFCRNGFFRFPDVLGRQQGLRPGH
jgi:hypothetical protein